MLYFENFAPRDISNEWKSIFFFSNSFKVEQVNQLYNDLEIEQFVYPIQGCCEANDGNIQNFSNVSRNEYEKKFSS